MIQTSSSEMTKNPFHIIFSLNRNSHCQSGRVCGRRIMSSHEAVCGNKSGGYSDVHPPLTGLGRNSLHARHLLHAIRENFSDRCTILKEPALAFCAGAYRSNGIVARWRTPQGTVAMMSTSAGGNEGRGGSSNKFKIVSEVFFPDGEVIRRGEEVEEEEKGGGGKVDLSAPVVGVADAAPRLPEVWGRVHSIESFSAVDGPGIRSVVFLQGCMRRCLYCANPDTWSPLDKCLRLSSKDIAARLRKNLPYFAGGGGVTISGGEPLLQPDFCASIFKESHNMGISTALDTAGYGDGEQWAKVLPHTDVVMLCVKAIDPRTYLKLVGMPQRKMLTFARHVALHRVPLVIRYVLVPGLTDTEAEIQGLIDFAKEQPSLQGVEILPYHTLGKNKWEELGIKYRLEGVPTPSKEVVESIKGRLQDAGLSVLV